jgi:hypothetical protein
MARKRRHRPEPTPPPPRPPAPPPRRALGHRHERTREALFADPVRTNITWDELVGLLTALGATTRTAGGSAHSFTLNGVVAVFHRPPPGNQLVAPLVWRVRRFLVRAGEAP